MRHYRFYVRINIVVFAEQIVFVVRIPVKRVFGAQNFYEINLPLAFRKVGLHRNAVRHLNFAQLFHQLIRTAGNKPRR